MPPAKRKTSARNSPLLDSLEQRLDLLTRTLSAADIAEKSIDIVKEIKELHAILRSLRDDSSPEGPSRLVVVWGGGLGRDLSGQHSALRVPDPGVRTAIDTSSPRC